MVVVPPEFNETFGDALRQVRKARGRRQVDVATDVSVDHSLVSRWESGAVLPTLKDLDAIHRSLGLSETEGEGLRYAWAREKEATERELWRVGLSMEEMIDSLEVSVACVRSLRKAGQPRMALRLSERDAHVAYDRIRQRKWSAGHSPALVGLSELLLEQCKAGLDYLPRSVVRRGALESVLQRQRLIGVACGQGKASFFLEIAREGTAYVGGDVGSAHEISQALLEAESDVPKGWLPEVVRAAAINAGRLSDKRTLLRVEAQLRRFLDERGDEFAGGTHAFVLEGVARGWGGVAPARGAEVIAAAWEVREGSRDSETSSQLRFVQLVRSQAEIEASLGARTNVNDTAEKVERALSLSRVEGYDRYVQQLEALGDRVRPSTR